MLRWPALVCPHELGGSFGEPVLLGGRCNSCHEPFFPIVRGCTRCSSTDIEGLVLGRSGTLWAWTLQMFAPKAPYDGLGEGAFRPYGIGYVELPNRLKIESRLVNQGNRDFCIGQPMRLVLEPYRKTAEGAEIFTYAFEPA